MKFRAKYIKYSLENGATNAVTSFTYVWQSFVLLAIVGMVGFLVQPTYSPAHEGYTEVKSSRVLTKYKQLESRFGTVSKVPPSQNTLSGYAGSVDTLPGMHHVISTVFWVGEIASNENGFIANTSSAWDEDWQKSFGGYDDPYNRNGYFPAEFTPKENPFYFALPYGDITDGGKRKNSSRSCPNAVTMADKPYSWCKNAWIMITRGDKTVYAQWEDVGPYEENDVSYVFGNAKPKNTRRAKAGLDVSPAVQSYLGLRDVDAVQWKFVDASAVPEGPWKQIVTTSLGYRL